MNRRDELFGPFPKRHQKVLVLTLRFWKWSFIEFFSLQHLKSWSIQEQRIYRNRYVKFYSLMQPQVRTEVVRLGSTYDGGYQVPVWYAQCDLLVSAGIGDNLEFEIDLLKEIDNGILIDGSIDRPENLPANGQFMKKFIGANTSIDSLSWSGVWRNVPEGVKAVIVKMDIEGGEWDAIPQILKEADDRLAILILELHDLRQILEASNAEQFIGPLEKLLDRYSVVWSGVNNCAHFYFRNGRRFPNVIECTLVRNDLCDGETNAEIQVFQNCMNLASFRMPRFSVK